MTASSGSAECAVYSYKDGSSVECLREHVKEALRLLKDAKNSNAVKYGERAFSSTVKTSYYSTLKYALIMHDFGKTYFSRMFGGRDRITFTGHEIISAWIVEKLGQKFWKELNVAFDPLLFSVLLHHHAMDIESRIDYFINNKYNANKVIIPSEDFRGFFEELRDLEEIRPIEEAFYKLDEAKERISVVAMAESMKEELKSFHWHLTSDPQSDSKMDHLRYLALFGLVVLDNVAASMRIKTKDSVRSVFQLSMEQTYRTYFGSTQLTAPQL